MPNAQAESFAARFKGFDVYLNQMVAVSASVCKNIFGHKYCLALATRPLPPAPAGLGVVQTTVDEDGVGIRVTISYDPKYLSVVWTVDTLYGVAAGIAAFGVTVGTSEV